MAQETNRTALKTETKLTRDAAVVGGATLLSRVLGYARDLTVAFTLGAGPLADAFFVAFRLPNLLRRLFGEGALTMSFVPVFAAARREQGDGAAFAMARSAFFWLALVLGTVSCAVMAVPETVVLLVAPGFSGDAELMARTANMVRICFPYGLFICSVALCMGVLNAMGSFLAPALAPVVLNLCLISGAVGAHLAGADVAHALCWAVLVAGMLQFLLQQPFLRSVGFAWSGPWSPRNRDVARAGRLLLPTTFGAAAFQAAVLLGTVFASLLERGAVSHLYYADRLVQLPLGVFAVAVGTAALPNLSELSGPGDETRFAATLDRAVGLSLFVNIPAAVGLAALAEPIVRVLFVRGAFSNADAAATSWALVAFSAGLPALAATRPLVAAFYARQQVRAPVIGALAALAVFAASAAVLTPLLGHAGIALAVSASAWANAAYLGLRLSSVLPGTGWFCAKKRVLLMALLSAPVGALALWSRVVGDLGSLLLIPVWAALYVLAARALKMDEAQELLGVLRRH